MWRKLKTSPKVRSLLRRSSSLTRLFDRRRSFLPPSIQRSIQSGIMDFTYRGYGFFKSPFDIALYLRLLEQLRPELIIEIGSAQGGSALWFAEMGESFSPGCQVHSFDINPPDIEKRNNLSFHKGDIHRLDDTPIAGLIAQSVGPVLVCEDGPHTEEGCSAALNFFATHLKRGDYLVIEDGNLRDLGYFDLHDGPNRALRHFHRVNPEVFEEDRRLSDFYGRNVTWNTNGWLRRL